MEEVSSDELCDIGKPSGILVHESVECPDRIWLLDPQSKRNIK